MHFQLEFKHFPGGPCLRTPYTFILKGTKGGREGQKKRWRKGDINGLMDGYMDLWMEWMDEWMEGQNHKLHVSLVDTEKRWNEGMNK